MGPTALDEKERAHAAALNAARMAELGQPLAEGDIVMSGAFGPMVPVGPGEVYLAEISGFSPIQVNFDDGRAGA